MDIISTFNSTFTINRLTEEQYNAAREAGEISGYRDFEFYMTEGDSGGGGDYVLSAATSTELGGIKIGYTKDVANQKYPVELDTTSKKAYVQVPLSDTLSVEEWIFTMDDSSTRTVKMAVWKN